MCRSKSVPMIRGICLCMAAERGERLYLALYRKYRPRTFDDVISQEHITTTLKNQVANGTAAHAYLFTGSRGTGKTSCAKIMAMAVNCLNPQNGNPCLECERCREILSGEATDIVEMDAASNNGVDDVRQLRDEVAYTPVSCKYRVYIIDEVHMLSPAAFNALLKTLEEPPPHVKFILATTELHKVPATISSRCQRFEFRRVDPEESTKRLMYVAEKENVQLDEDAAYLISRLSDGGMRDALSILDRCISADEHITSQIVRDCAGVADNKHLYAFSQMVANKDVAGCIHLLGELHKNSKDLALVIDELSEHYRDLMLYKVAPSETDILSALPDDYERIAKTAEIYNLDNILRCLTLLQQCADNIGKTKQRKTLAEMCLVKMCTGADARTAYVPKTAVQKSSYPTIMIKEPPKEEFVSRTVEQMTERERKDVKRTQNLINETKAKLAGDDTNPQIVQNPQNIEDNNVLPTIEPPSDTVTDTASNFEPPWEDVPPSDDNFFNNDYPINSEDKPKQSESENKAEEKTVEPVSENKEIAKDVPNEITDEQWKTAVSKLDFFHQQMFSDSKAILSDGVLEVYTSNSLLSNNVNDDVKRSDAKEAISKALGFPIKLKVIAVKSEQPEEEKSKLDKLLSKARQFGIEVQNKND